MDARNLLPLIAHILETNAEAQRTQAGSMPAPSPRRWDPWERGGDTVPQKGSKSWVWKDWSQESKRLGFRGFVSCPSSRLLLQQDQWTLYTTFSLDTAMSSNLTFPAKEKVGWGEWGEGRGGRGGERGNSLAPILRLEGSEYGIHYSVLPYCALYAVK